jgi:hypothetical protein
MRVQLHQRIGTHFRSGGQHLLVPNLVRYPHNRTEQNYGYWYRTWTLDMSQGYLYFAVGFFLD